MLKQIKFQAPEHILLGDANAPAFFKSALEFSVPARGTWNIVHTGMLLPGSQQIYIGAIGCLRGVILTAAEMGKMHRFSSIIVNERDLLDGRMEDLIVDGVSDILKRLDHTPTAVLLFPTCIHHFLGIDLPECYRRLRNAWPQIGFGECFMDPIMRKNNFNYDQRLRQELYRFLPSVKKNSKTVNIIGCNLPTFAGSELYKLAHEAGCTILDLTRCQSWEDYLKMAEASLNIYYAPPADYAVRELERRLGTPYLYLPISYDMDEVETQLDKFAKALGLPCPNFSSERSKANAAWNKVRSVIGSAPIALDFTFTFRPFSLARMLTERGFNVARIYADGVQPDDLHDFSQLKTLKPDIEIYSTVHANMRRVPRGHIDGRRTLALGQKAAFFTQTPYFVPFVETGGLYGITGLTELAHLVLDAWTHPKDTQAVLDHKGWSCDCCLE